MDGSIWWYSRFCLYESFLFLTLLDEVAAGTGAALLAIPDGDELDCCRRAHPSQLRAPRATTTGTTTRKQQELGGTVAPSGVCRQEVGRPNPLRNSVQEAEWMTMSLRPRTMTTMTTKTILSSTDDYEGDRR